MVLLVFVRKEVCPTIRRIGWWLRIGSMEEGGGKLGERENKLVYAINHAP